MYRHTRAALLSLAWLLVAACGDGPPVVLGHPLDAGSEALPDAEVGGEVGGEGGEIDEHEVDHDSALDHEDGETDALDRETGE